MSATGFVHTIFRSIAQIAATLALAVLIAACGSGGGGGGGSPQSVAPSITTQPAGASAMDGATATFTVVAGGDAPLTYQWQKNSANIAGANAASYTTPALTLADNGAQFRVIVSNLAGSATSSAATATVTPIAITISQQPMNTAAPDGLTASFSVTAGGSAPITYQWRRNGADITGATAASYTTPALTLADNGAQYAVVLTNPAGNVTSSAATLTVNAAAPVIASQPADISVRPTNTATFTVGANSTAIITYQWQRSDDGGMSWTNIGGATANSYTTGALQLMDSNARFRVNVTASAMTVTSNAATLTVSTTLSLLAGGVGGYGTADGDATIARFYEPFDVAFNSSGDMYVSDAFNQTIRKVTPAGVVSTLAGYAQVPGSTDGIGSTARLRPLGIAVDSAGNVFVAETSNHTIRRISPAGHATLFAGSPGAVGSTDATGVNARFNNPIDIAIDGSDNLYVVEFSNHTIRKITPMGVVTTVAGSAGTQGDTDATGAAARFNSPSFIAIDNANGFLYVTDTSNNTVRKIVISSGVVTTLAGSAGMSGYVDATGGAARFNFPRGIAINAAGDLFVADSGNTRIRKITVSTGAVTTFVGSGVYGTANGTGTAAELGGVQGMAFDSAGTLHTAEMGSQTIRRISSGAVVSSFVGVFRRSGSTDGTGAAARFNDPLSVAVDSSGNAYVVDGLNHTVRKITPAGVTTTFAGSPGATGTADGTGTAARFNSPRGIGIDSMGNLYVSDSGNGTIRKITPAGVVTTFAGTPGMNGSVDGGPGVARFYDPRQIAVDSLGNLYVASGFDHTVRKVTSAGAVSTLAGLAGNSGTNNGTGNAARFNLPIGIAVDSAGNVFVSEFASHTVRQITSAGVVTTLAGSANSPGLVNATGGSARFDTPHSLAVDSGGNVYVAEFLNSTIRKITPGGTVSTLIGEHRQGTVRLGDSGLVNRPQGIAIGANGRLVITAEDAVLSY